MSHYSKQTATAKSTLTLTKGSPPGLPLSLTGKTDYANIGTGVKPVTPTTLPPTTDASDLPENVTELRRLVAKLRTEVGLKNNQLQQAYEKQANQRLKEVVELERRHFQAQVDEVTVIANEQIIKANKEADHWREQVKIIYDLLEQQTQEAERLIAGLQAEVVRLSGQKSATVKKPKVKKVSGKLKRQLEGE